MASESDASETPLIERLINSRNRDLSMFIPFMLGINSNTIPTRETRNPDGETRDPDGETRNSTTSRDRIILINPFTQGMIVIEGASGLDSLLRELSNKGGQPPASKASIEAMPEVVIEEESGGGECMICLEEWEINGVAKQMPCNHKFHSECIEKWLKIHGSCPVCRFKMPVEEQVVDKKRDVSFGDVNGDNGNNSERSRRVEREIWVTFSFNSSTSRRGDSDHGDFNDSSSSPRPDQEMEG